ncbi:histone-like nucleoid-structuring protein Lsr2 [Streptomyces sp. NPDC057689]|uniref:Lsr2 family DNA-binding protein n=1 Tax=Streptomyces sp. NPDC057689 TaxID=3346213 RepID=UPI003699B945
MDEQQQPPYVQDAQPQGDDAVRVWARANGYLVNDRGRIPAAIREAYAEEHPRAAV